MSKKSEPLKDRLKEFLAKKLRDSSVPLWTRKSHEADQKLVLRGGVDLDEDDGLDFSCLRKDTIEAGLFYQVRYRGAWLREKLKGVFRCTR
jgi:hypothetical protein